jgi:hypothetical protein
MESKMAKILWMIVNLNRIAGKRREYNYGGSP